MNSTSALTRDDAALSELGGGRPSERRKLLRRVWRTKGLVIGGSVVFVIVLIAVFGPFVAPHDPLRGRMLDRLAPPIWAGGTTEYILGTDALGRDELSRLILGARVSLEAGASGTLVAALFGVALGLLAGYFSGALDWVIPTWHSGPAWRISGGVGGSRRAPLTGRPLCACSSRRSRRGRRGIRPKGRAASR